MEEESDEELEDVSEFIEPRGDMALLGGHGSGQRNCFSTF
jgi:hypothetical protein